MNFKGIKIDCHYSDGEIYIELIALPSEGDEISFSVVIVKHGEALTSLLNNDFEVLIEDETIKLNKTIKRLDKLKRRLLRFKNFLSEDNLWRTEEEIRFREEIVSEYNTEYFLMTRDCAEYFKSLCRSSGTEYFKSLIDFAFIGDETLSQYPIPDRLFAFSRAEHDNFDKFFYDNGFYSRLDFDTFRSFYSSPDDFLATFKDRMDINESDLPVHEKALKLLELEHQGRQRTYFFTYGYKLNNINQLMALELTEIYKRNLPIKKCACCNKYFIPQKRSDAIYCDGISPFDTSKSCKEYGARQAWQQTLKTSESAKLYRDIYMSKQMLAKRNPDMADYKKSFEKYKQEAKRWKVDVKLGTKTELAFIAWLKEVKEKKVL